MKRIEIIDIYKTAYEELFDFLYENKIECTVSEEKIGHFYDVTIETKNLDGIEVNVGSVTLISDLGDTVDLLPNSYGYMTIK